MIFYKIIKIIQFKHTGKLGFFGHFQQDVSEEIKDREIAFGELQNAVLRNPDDKFVIKEFEINENDIVKTRFITTRRCSF